jgi:glycosyltransferase involved in cell wall biosynthesis
MARYQTDILIFGDICAFDLIVGEYLARRGVRVCVARRNRDSDRKPYVQDVPSGFLRALSYGDIITVDGPAALLRKARSARLVLTFSGALAFTLKWRWFYWNALGYPPVINYSTGSDFSELLGTNSLLGRFYRWFVRSCKLNMGFPYPHTIKNLVAQRVTNVVFPRFSYLLPEPGLSAPTQGHGRRLRYFHPSHLDFRVTDAARERNSSKGNDRFIRAFLRALDNGVDAECVMLDRGPDREIARQMIDNSKHADRFLWRPHLDREAFFQEMAQSDVVVDQFDVGGLGGIAVEAMSMKKPVLVHLEKACLNIVYPEFPPVLNAFSEDEIYTQILLNTDPDVLAQKGELAAIWVRQNHSWENCLDTLLFYYSVLTGHELVDYGYQRNAYGL